MFTINISFKDALTCFETLSHIKPDEELQSIESEFVKYARQKARVGDSAAQAWLKNNTITPDPDEGMSESPMSYFVDMERPTVKDEELEELVRIEAEELRIQALEEEREKEEQLVIPPLTKDLIKDALRPLDKLVGLGPVKQDIRRILESKIIDQRREEAGLKIIEQPANHMVFTGNPGTGKTTVARLIAKIFKEVGLLSKGHLTEVTRSDLIGEYIGQTEQIVKETLQKAKGGVLFIDEAYNLYKPYSQNDYGQDVVSALIKYMEDHRNDIIIIMAGYSDMMKSFLKSNPGLKSRIPHHLSFDDMKEDQLLTIFQALCDENDYELDDGARKALLTLLKDMKRKEESEFPNARGVRNLFEEVLRRQSERLLNQDICEKEALRLITKEDIPRTKAVSDGKVVHLPRN